VPLASSSRAGAPGAAAAAAAVAGGGGSQVDGGYRVVDQRDKISICDLEVIAPWGSIDCLTPDATQLADADWQPEVLVGVGLGGLGWVGWRGWVRDRKGSEVRVAGFKPSWHCNAS